MSLGFSKIKYFILLIVLLLQACSSPSRYKIRNDHGPSTPVDVSNVGDAIPKEEPRSKYGNPKNYKVLGRWYKVRKTSSGYKEKGISSWYGKKFHGHRTSSGETYNMYAMTAAHKTLPLPTYVRVTHLKNGRSVIVKVNDRGPFHQGRIIDLSYAAAKKLGVTATGIAAVEVVAIDPKTYKKQERLHKPTAVSIYPAKSNFKLFLQIGAFKEQVNAEKLKTRLNRMFKQQQIHSIFSTEQKVFRVRIGPLSSIAVADKLSIYLNKKGLPTTKIVID